MYVGGPLSKGAFGALAIKSIKPFLDFIDIRILFQGHLILSIRSQQNSLEPMSTFLMIILVRTKSNILYVPLSVDWGRRDLDLDLDLNLDFIYFCNFLLQGLVQKTIIVSSWGLSCQNKELH